MQGEKTRLDASRQRPWSSGECSDSERFQRSSGEQQDWQTGRKAPRALCAAGVSRELLHPEVCGRSATLGLLRKAAFRPWPSGSLKGRLDACVPRVLTSQSLPVKADRRRVASSIPRRGENCVFQSSAFVGISPLAQERELIIVLIHFALH